MEKVYWKKQEQKNQLKNLKNNYIVTIYDGLIKNHSLKQIKQQLLKDTLNSKYKDRVMLNNAYNMARKLKAKVDNTKDAEMAKMFQNEDNNIAILSAYVFKLMNQMQMEKELSKNITKETNKQEGKDKDDALKKDIEYNRGLKNPRVFYLASEHLDSAKDHKPWQGRIYVDEYWPRYIKSEELRKEITDYILENDIRMWQWVLGRPVLFITRPNCRHYYKSLSVGAVLHKSLKYLIEKNDMHRTFGDRQYMQTMRYAENHSMSQMEILRNAQLVLDAYKERLKLHTALYEKGKSNFIRMAISKDKLLIKKWQDYIIKLQK